ncbi:aldo/keto reductase [Streptomyces sp. NBC_01220]|uniref:aldo/keto reductase n=1 Tax=unclassified Streptomyces TaxID=2593676 RepID=UPI002E3036A1|nr:aldo/keto reductase [Streptomyces sp. NBC_01358]WSQ48598.1 aldo/keto reductase [Streptomyces sp. NBC_01220]
MRTRSAARTPALTELGFGAAQLGNLGRVTSDEDASGAVDAAWRSGVRYFDTAPHYGLGLSERRLGAALSRRPRSQYTVSTKVGRLLVPSPRTAHLGDDGGFVVPAASRRSWDFSRDGILRSLEGSLERLGLDHVDIVYLHDPDDHWQEASTTGVDTLVELRDQGVVKAVGAGMNRTGMLTEFVRRCDVDIVMVAGRHTLLDHSAADELLPLALERGVGVVAAAVYNSGLLAAPRPPMHATYDYRPASREVLGRATAIADVCERHGSSLPEAAIAHPLRHPAVTSVVLGARNAHQSRINAERLAALVPDTLWDELTALSLLPASPATRAADGRT